MKSMLFSALLIVAVSVGSAAAQNGASCSSCNNSRLGARMGAQQGPCGSDAVVSITTNCSCNECSVAPPAQDCGCAAAPAPSSGCGCGDSGVSRNCGDSPVGQGLFSNLGDNRGMGLRLNGKGAACGADQGSGLFSRLKARCGGNKSDDCGCGEVVTADACGCDTCDSGVAQCAGEEGSGGLFGKLAGGCCGLSALKGKCGLGGCGLGGCGLGGKLGGKLGGGRLGGGYGHGFGHHGLGGRFVGPGAPYGQPYGGAVPHTNQGAGGLGATGTAPSYAYPYYTTRGPRDFLMKKPPTIGY